VKQKNSIFKFSNFVKTSINYINNKKMKTDRNILRKCAIMLALIVLGAFLLEACAKEPSTLEGTGIITMTTKATTVTFSVKGDEDITIDWGDGKKSYTKDALGESEMIPGLFVFAHDYSGADVHDIVITCSNVTQLYCTYNDLTALDISRCTTLDYLICSNNQLTGLDVSKNTKLHNLNCNFNQITSLNVSNNTELWGLYCIGNRLTTEALNDLFRTLPDYSEKGYGAIFIAVRWAKPEVGNPGHAYCDRSIAEKKGWAFMTLK
jgi:Leucine-rich repeat (LRR) protein